MLQRLEARIHRHERIRRGLEGTAARPRLAVFRSAKHIYAQVIDDAAGKTLAHAASTEKALRAMKPGAKKSAVAQAVGKLLAERCKGKGVTKVAFDRGGFRYHGRIAALAKGAREAGLQF